MYNKLKKRNLAKFFFMLCLTINLTFTEKFEQPDLDDKPIDESKTVDDDDQSVKGLINSLNLNEKVEIDSKNPTLKELKEKIDKMLKKKKEEMKEEEKKKSDDKVVNLKPKNDENCMEGDKDSKESQNKGFKSDDK